MKAKTLIELLTLTSGLYVLSKDEELMGRLKNLTDKGKERVNKAMATPEYDEDGNELEFIDKLIKKAGQTKEEIEEYIHEIVANFYNKINVAHTDEIRGLNERLESAEKSIALLEAKIKTLEQK